MDDNLSTATRGFSIVVAMDKNRGIGKDGKLPWSDSQGNSILKGDMKFFKELTTCPDRGAVEKRWGMVKSPDSAVRQWTKLREELKSAPELPNPDSEFENVVIMGRKTWESLPDAFHPLSKRQNAVLSKADSPVSYWAHGYKRYFQFEYALEKDSVTPWVGVELFVIGGGQIFAKALSHSACTHLYITEIDTEFECDTRFPEARGFQPVLSSPWVEENGIRYRFTRWDRVSSVIPA